ncbi:hypothetical protein Sjap_007536 [Stephania japonica]|uniref:Cyclic nucleotide-binding domain-containing protein n=1 Tax=Stephania japonica TaxID=461633 RepID=A0AAP0PAI7_9MAGN
MPSSSPKPSISPPFSYFDSEQGATHFTAVHKVFGANNVSKLLLCIPPHKRLDVVIPVSAGGRIVAQLAVVYLFRSSGVDTEGGGRIIVVVRQRHWDDVERFFCEIRGLCRMLDCGGYKLQFIGGEKEKFGSAEQSALIRLDELDSSISSSSYMGKMNRSRFSLSALTRAGRGTKLPSRSLKKGVQKGTEGLRFLGRSLKFGVTRAVFPEDLKVSEKKIFDPQDRFLLLWNRLFIISCILAVSVDPLFLYLPIINRKSMCLACNALPVGLLELSGTYLLWSVVMHVGRKLAMPMGNATQIFCTVGTATCQASLLGAPSVNLFLIRHAPTLGQGLQTSTYPGETYLQSLTIRLEEMRVKRRDSEQWMHHRMLPQDLRERVRRYDQYKWLETRGVDEENLVQSLPKDLRRDIKRHLCLALVRRVPLFDNMDERLLDAICERLRPSLYTESTYIHREGDPVDEMLFIIRGRLESVTTDGGRSGFFNRSLLKEGDFCGEELLTWALDPKSGSNLPSSTRTVKALTEVEAFALFAEELKFVASQFRRLHSRQVQHTFRFYSQQWRTWAACFIQAAWRRYCKRKTMELRHKEEEELDEAERVRGSSSSLGATIYASRFAANAMRGVHRLRNKSTRELVKLPKPPEPDFSIDDAE